MRRSRWRGRPPSCRRHHQGVAGQGNISDLNQITDIDWEEQTYSMHLISGWESLPSSTWPPLGCYLISALGSTSSSAPLQVHLGRGDLPLTTVITLYCFSNLLFADIPYPPDYNFWFHGCKSEACSRSKHQEVILPIHQVKVYSKIIITAVLWTRTRNLTNYTSKNPLQVALGPQSLRRASSMELVHDVPLWEWSIQPCLCMSQVWMKLLS